MNVLELFAGSKSIGNVAEQLGMDVYSSDIEQFGGIDYVVDILEFDVNNVPFKPDIIWASPPCTGFSVAAIGRNWTKTDGDAIPKSDTARLGIELVKKTIEIIDYFNPQYFFIENPRGMLRKLQIMQRFMLHSVTYCQYGDTRMKPTDIWTNSQNWVSRPACKNGDPCHISAPRGSRTGTQGLANAYERSKIPEQLCEEILKSCI
tara:strand:+ start:182 stop:796 length:615 start_codon:yes stop_codon:yes gene_type:complete